MLLHLIAEGERAAWVTPTSDAALEIIGHGYAALSSICDVGCPRPEIVARVLGKSQTLAAAMKCGVPVPKSVTIVSVDDREADAHFGEGLLFQEYKPGQRVGVGLLMHNGTPVAHFQHRRLSELPPSGGVAVVAVSEPPDPVLLDHSVRLLREIEWEGVAMVEFRHDPVTGTAALMKVNGHFWGSIALPVAAGVDFPLYAWQIASGVKPLPPTFYTAGLRVRWTAGALQRFRHAAAAVPDGHATGRRPLNQLLRDFQPGVRSALWAWSDPAPAVQESMSVVAGTTRDAIRTIVSAVVPRPALAAVKTACELPRGRRAHYLTRRALRALGAEPRQRLPAKIESVLFVCHGNIMRSAAAAQFLRDALAASGTHHVSVASAGTTTSAGRLADPRVKAATLRFGTSLGEHRSQPLTAELVLKADVIFAMDDLNVVNIASTFPTARGKLMLLGGMHASGEWVPNEIVDPYHATDDDVYRTIAQLYGCVRALHEVLASSR